MTEFTSQQTQDGLTLRHDMIDYLKRDLPVELHAMVDGMNISQLMTGVDNRYEGGFARYASVLNAHDPVADDQLDPQIMFRRQLRTLLGRQFVIAACHQIIRVDLRGDRIHLVIRVIDTVERATRVIERGAVVRLVVFDATTSRMLPDEGFELTDPDWNGDTTVNSYIRIMDPERYTSKFWQWYECYRPGTERTPLDGYKGPTRVDTLFDEYDEFKRTMERVNAA